MNAYYSKTFAYMMFMPVLLLIAVVVCMNGLDAALGERLTLIYVDMTVVLFVGLCVLVMMLYGYLSARKYRNQGNESVIYLPLSKLYLPLFFPMAWYLLWTSLLNFFDVHVMDDLLGAFILIFVMINPYATFIFNHYLPPVFGLDDSHSILIYNLLYYGILILGFAAGERIYTLRKKDRSKAERKTFVVPEKSVIIFFAVVICVYSLSEFVLYQQRKNIVSSARTAMSYGFAYEGGFSSTNLEPYHVDNESNILAKLDETSTFIIENPLDMPVLDGAEAAYPVYAAFANACYANIAEIQSDAITQRLQARLENRLGETTIIMPIVFSNTIYAYEKLLDGEVDICFGARPSEKQLRIAEKQGKEVVLTPIGKEGFIFFINDANPVENLSSEQIRDIYSGKIKNWREVGGNDDKILAFQRPENSGSQTMMEYFMGDTHLKAPLKAEYYESMGGLLKDIAAYDNGKASIGYSFRYFATMMVDERSEKSETTTEEASLEGIKFLAVDGVYPDEDTIRSGEYPLTTQLYAITVLDKNSPTGTYSKDTIEPFLEWMTGPQGQQIVSDTGYVSLN